MPSTRSLLLACTTLLIACSLLEPRASAQSATSFYPGEDSLHEGTWLQWPHRFTYGLLYQQDLDPIWVDMTAALVQSENVHIIAYNAAERARIQSLLTQAGVSLAKVDFLIRKTDDCWVRDNGPVFVLGEEGELQISDWGFNGWGFDAPYQLDDPVPGSVAAALDLPLVDMSAVVLEGGAIEVDGRGTLMATRSSILDPARNPGLSQADVEAAMTQALGVSHFIWLDGSFGGQLDITDTHIDGVARFSEQTIVTMKRADLIDYGLTNADVDTLYAATNAQGQPFDFLELPLSKHDVVTTYGLDLGFRGSYVNFYTANTVVLVPTYADPNDAVALALLQQHYTDRTVIGIDVRDLFVNGGMVHCVTQQQPAVTLDAQSAWSDLGSGLPGTHGAPQLVGSGTLLPLLPVSVELTAAAPQAVAGLVVGTQSIDAPFKGGVMVPAPQTILLGPPTNASGEITLSADWPAGIAPGFTLFYQYWIVDPNGPAGYAASNALSATTP